MATFCSLLVPTWLNRVPIVANTFLTGFLQKWVKTYRLIVGDPYNRSSKSCILIKCFSKSSLYWLLAFGMMVAEIADIICISVHYRSCLTTSEHKIGFVDYIFAISPLSVRYIMTYLEENNSTLKLRPEQNGQYIQICFCEANLSSHVQISQRFVPLLSAPLTNSHLWPLLLTWFNFNPSMDK